MWLAIRSAALQKNSEPSLPPPFAKATGDKPRATVRILRCAKDGRVWAAQLERLREYHRESGNLGKRYVEVIRAFNPDFPMLPALPVAMTVADARLTS